MNLPLRSITDGYGERMARLALFEPLMNLKKKTRKDNQGAEIDFYGLGLLTLLFFFECRLLRQRRTGVAELARFLKDVQRQFPEPLLDLEDPQYEKVARELVDTFRPPGGRGLQASFFNYHTGRQETVSLSILKAGASDTDANAQYYTLDEDGLALVFATREYYAEFQISINQLVIRKQLEKGEFASALRQIDEMRMAVEKLSDSMLRIRHEVNRNIVSDDTYQRYRSLVEDTFQRLTRENEEFEELQVFVMETRRRLDQEASARKHPQAYERIGRIEQELASVHHSHRLLLQDCTKLKNTAVDAFYQMLLFSGVDSFNFDQEITARLLSVPLPLEAARQLVKPFLHLEKTQVWSPLTVFAPQRIAGEKSQEEAQVFLEASGGRRISRRQYELKKRFLQWMEGLLEVSIDSEKKTRPRLLSEAVAAMEQRQPECTSKPSFYGFWIWLHHQAPLTLHAESHSSQGTLEETLLEKPMAALLRQAGVQLWLEETGEILTYGNRFQIQEMKLIWEEDFPWNTR
ncbi:hypothetical protein SAMN05192551_1144 [Tindallia magadiensis]|uniref:Replicative DNA helicase n=1 Tax=Tindallia magadiensis TaxID=69895 RepID=A0A1I3HL53_9FIRM|nr:hypothetical protein [Tindallia magadiensis]SFI36465.1 hypothetical protein SAMN05192551_1144 [Tindallia magadiensis]